MEATGVRMADNTTDESAATVEALTGAVAAAGRAPSIHNTQPWRWRVRPDRLELLVATDRQLPATDPDRKMLTLSCGAALHHAGLVLSAGGWATRVERLPDPGDPELLAVVVPTGRTAATTAATQLAACVGDRHTDRRPVSDEPVPEATLRAITGAAVPHGTRLQILDRDRMLAVAAAATRAGTTQYEDPRIRDELAYWTGRTATGHGTGVPAGVVPAHAPQTTVPARDFGRPGVLPVGTGHDRAAVYGLLFGDEDEPDSWLRAGEALSAAWLTATRLGVSMVPLSWVVEVSATRQALRGILSGLGQPYLVLRIGFPDRTPDEPVPRTPRLPVEQIMDVTGPAPRGG
ncbi:NAD(P)H nitroreductase [Polymorphospora rubra]|uniref:NAD(P)H nitroreductase n=2 Tax=Polymorphospora rubra TaxID=338584 RepID=A0A810NB55_9ACTN|nr:NAD(P)H nitroreductase [Polymorphospora rubra]